MTFPVSFGYGSSAITKVSLIRPATVTHSYDMSQRYAPVSYLTSATSDSLTITAVPDPRIAPPGYYMLFLVNVVTTQAEGHPSKADFVLLWGIRNKTVTKTVTYAPGTWTLKVEWWTTAKATEGDQLVVTPLGGSPVTITGTTSNGLFHTATYTRACVPHESFSFFVRSKRERFVTGDARSVSTSNTQNLSIANCLE